MQTRIPKIAFPAKAMGSWHLLALLTLNVGLIGLVLGTSVSLWWGRISTASTVAEVDVVCRCLQLPLQFSTHNLEESNGPHCQSTPINCFCFFHAAQVTLCVFKVTGETNTDDLSPAPDAWSRPDIPLHALAMLKLGSLWYQQMVGNHSTACH